MTAAMSARATLIVAVILAAVIVAVGVFVWPMLSALAGSGGGLLPAIIMVVGCFAIGGALMFLIFYSARRGLDEQVYRGNQQRPSKKD